MIGPLHHTARLFPSPEPAIAAALYIAVAVPPGLRILPSAPSPRLETLLRGHPDLYHSHIETHRVSAPTRHSPARPGACRPVSRRHCFLGSAETGERLAVPLGTRGAVFCTHHTHRAPSEKTLVVAAAAARHDTIASAVDCAVHAGRSVTGSHHMISWS